MKILIVEDESVLFDVLQEKFERQKFEVAIAKNGMEAIPLAKTFKPDVILLDLILPVIDGVDVLAHLKKDTELAKIPVIVLTNLNEDKIVKEVLLLGAVEYLVKTEHPLNYVVEKINKHILNQ